MIESMMLETGAFVEQRLRARHDTHLVINLLSATAAPRLKGAGLSTTRTMSVWHGRRVLAKSLPRIASRILIYDAAFAHVGAWLMRAKPSLEPE